MKKRPALLALVIALTACCALLPGCGDPTRSGGTYDEPDITVEYLSGKYASQLVRDGAEHIFGTVVVAANDAGETSIEIDAKEYVEDSTREDGYYIADRNLTVSAILADEARITYPETGAGSSRIITPQEFTEAAAADEESGRSQEMYYDIYVMNGQAQLILTRALP